ncbi:tagatose-bisphosphate aldolase [Rheinheimera mesophila]|uniref:Tagatose-bisphosphate aldolase n=1 Tax=Rheinheimera mesophila TaxID=1547515 RepID=A0A3P3QLJ7_9GAMM|nr:class II D-tagatose-bisphosphate aldolase, non-catalytic subunit [Rheinheimera mesophila]KKK99901.1 tagatose-bisphosphate aldolase [Rheinheimera mesophila]RRJ21350.1 tagatose-bisphosphate aldolase [Rheinheimera mesophila]
MNALSQILQQNKQGLGTGIYSVCSAQPLVLRAALRRAKADGSVLLIEATANQVNQFGGYTGMLPADFIAYVQQLAKQEGLAQQQLMFGGDHLGPVVWCKEPAEQAMQKAEQLIAVFVQAGFSKIHLDTSMACADDPAVLSDEVIANRAARLCKVAEQHRKPDQQLCYVIGTEVPAPGGVTELEHELAPTPVQAVLHTLNTHKAAFAAAALADEVWQKVIAVVVQPGVEFDNSKVHLFDAPAAQSLTDFIQRQQGLVYEAHSTDYQLPEHLQALVQGHFAILKVGPGLTFALREALFALSFIEDELVAVAQSSQLRQRCKALMQDKPAYWQKFYTDTEQGWQLLYSFSDRLRYYWPEAALQQATETLFSNLSKPLPLPLLSQFLPAGYQAVLRGSVPNNAKDLVIHHIDQVLATYAKACALAATSRSR